MTSKIQKGIPVPERHVPPPRPRKYPLDTMEVGDFFFAEGVLGTSMSPYVSSQSKKLGRKFITRSMYARQGKSGWVVCEPDDARGVKGVGIWRVS